MEGLRKTTKNMGQLCRFPDRDLNQEPNQIKYQRVTLHTNLLGSAGGDLDKLRM
jgi:hypothetical protein